MALRCVYTDLDGTLLGPRGSLFRDPEENFSLRQARALEACHRAGVEVAKVNEVLREQGHADLRFLDNGAIGRQMKGIEGHTHAYHLVPGGASKAKGVAFHVRARGYDPESCIGIGDSIEDLEAAASVGRFFVVANGPERDEALRQAVARFANATVTEGAMGDGFYEAVITTLAERR